MNEQDMTQLEEEMQEYMQDAKIEELLRTDYDYFLEYYEYEIEELREAFENVKKLHLINDWYCSEDEIKELI